EQRGTIMAVLRMGNRDMSIPPAAIEAAPGEEITQVSHQVDGAQGQYVPPTPVATMGAGIHGVPHPMMMGMPGQPGQPAHNHITGAPGAPMWGMPITGTPIGLP